MSTVTIQDTDVAEILTNLLSREVGTSPDEGLQPHTATYRGLVTNEDELVAVIGSDLDFAHRSGAALAMIPAGSVDDRGDSADPDLIELYREVANVLSRLVDAATTVRLRLDPGIEHPVESLESIVAGGSCAVACRTTIEGYGSGSVGVWFRAA